MLHTDLDDTGRLAALHATALLDAPREPSFERIARIAAGLTGAAAGLVSLVGDDWITFIGASGLEGDGAPVPGSLCRYVVALGEPLVVEDVAADARVDDDIAMQALGMAAYLGVPFRGPDGHVLGALCALDTVPRQWTDTEVAALTDLAASVDAELQLRAMTDEALSQSEHLAAVGAAALDAILVMAPDGILLDLNPAAVELFGYSREEAVGRELAELIIPPRNRAGHRAALAGHRATGLAREEVIGRRSEFMALRADGSELPVELSVTRTEVGGRVRFTGFVRDLGEVRRAEQARAAAEARAAMVVDAAPMVLFAFDADGVVSHAAGTGLRSLGREAEEVIGRSVFDLWAGDERTLASFRRVLAGESFTTLRSVGDGVFESRYRPLTGEDGSVEGAVGVSLNVTERERTAARIQQLAYTDGLTGLPNRIALQELASVTLEAHRERGAAAALLCVNLDDFGTVNESFGHHAGDEVLRDAAERLEYALGGRGVLSRQGGDEFLIFVPDLGGCPAATLEGIALDAIQVLERPLVHEDVEFTVRACIGSSTYPDDGERFEELLHHADLAMHRAKAAGHGRYAAYQHQGSDARHRLTITTRLRRALAEGELELHYQPLFGMASGRPEGVEALLRWNDPVHGLVPPLDFVPAAEATGLIVELGAWVAETACEQLAAWTRLGLEIVVGINVSPRQFGTGNFPDHLAELLSRTGVDPARFVIEITETAAMDGTPETARDLQRLSAMGVHVVVDDFGAGYSSLTRLRQLPVAALKLDRGLLDGFPADPAAAAVVGASIALAEALGVTTVAEGIEHEEQRAALAELGCTLGQGFALARPMPVAEATAFLLEHGAPRRGVAAATAP